MHHGGRAYGPLIHRTSAQGMGSSAWTSPTPRRQVLTDASTATRGSAYGPLTTSWIECESRLGHDCPAHGPHYLPHPATEPPTDLWPIGCQSLSKVILGSNGPSSVVALQSSGLGRQNTATQVIERSDTVHTASGTFGSLNC